MSSVVSADVTTAAGTAEPVHVYFAIDAPSGEITAHTDAEFTDHDQCVEWSMLANGEPQPKTRTQNPGKNDLAWAVLDELWILQQRKPCIIRVFIRSFRVQLTVGIVFAMKKDELDRIKQHLRDAIQKVTGRDVEILFPAA